MCLVDELDDPRPGHLSDHPVALTSVTTPSDGSDERPYVGTLDERFVKGETEETAQDPSVSDSMKVDSDEKENST